MSHRSGFLAVVGRPNVGKSTLVNRILGQKISIVTSKPHTTRHAIMGVLTQADAQLVFIDTPGLAARAGRLLNRAMNKAAGSALESADIAVLVVEAGRWVQGDDYVLESIKAAGVPCALVLNKIDRIKPRDKLLPVLQAASGRHDFIAIVPVSATAGDNLDRLVKQLAMLLPEQEPLYSAATVSNRDLGFRVAETLREKLMTALHQEVPYGLGVEISQMEEDPDGRLVVDATIWVDRESHKGIVLGKGGALIKHVGTQARLELQRALHRPVHLESHVKVKQNWSDNAQSLQQLGYDGEL